MLTQDRVRELFYYEPDTGWLIRRTDPLQERAGYLRKDGRRGIKVDGEAYFEHRIIWLWMTGYLPPEIDHKNLDRGDNRWSNLRECSRSQNNANRRIQPNNKMKMRGIHQISNGRFRVRIQCNGKRVADKVFEHKSDAIVFHAEAMKKAFGEFARV